MSNQPIPAANRDVTQRDNRTTTSEKIDYAGIETDRLKKEYGGLEATLQRLREESEAIAEVPDDETGDSVAIALGGIIKRARDLRAEVDNTRVVEVEPNFRRYQAGNAFFNAIKEAIQPEDKRQRRTSPGLIDETQAKIDVHQNRKEARERARLQAERIELERIAQAAKDKADREAKEAAEKDRVAQEAAEAAERARNPEKIAEKTEIAEQAAQAASEQGAAAVGAEIIANQTREAATDARIATLAKSSDLVRTTGSAPDGGGVMLTKATDKVAELEDRGALTDEAKLVLFEHFTDDQVGMAIRKFANATGHRTKLPGCLIEVRKKNVTR